MQTGIVRAADGLLLPPQAFGPMFQAFVEVALSPFKRSPIVVRTTTPHSVPFFHLDMLQGLLTAAVDGVRGSNTE